MSGSKRRRPIISPELRRDQPEGPYHLAGFSGGGITAYEIAQQLSAAGQEVGSLILLDTPLPVRPSLSRLDKGLIKLHEIRRKGPAYFAEWLRNRIEWQAEKRRRAVQREAGAEAGGFDNAGIERAFLAAVGAYEAKPWDGAVTLFRPGLDRHWPVSGGNFVSREREYVFEDNQWRPLAPKLEVIEVPGITTVWFSSPMSAFSPAISGMRCGRRMGPEGRRSVLSAPIGRRRSDGGA